MFLQNWPQLSIQSNDEGEWEWKRNLITGKSHSGHKEIFLEGYHSEFLLTQQVCHFVFQYNSLTFVFCNYILSNSPGNHGPCSFCLLRLGPVSWMLFYLKSWPELNGKLHRSPPILLQPIMKMTHVLERTCDGLGRLCRFRRVWLKHCSYLQVNMGCALAFLFQVRSLNNPAKDPLRGHFWESLVLRSI